MATLEDSQNEDGIKIKMTRKSPLPPPLQKKSKKQKRRAYAYA